MLGREDESERAGGHGPLRDYREALWKRAVLITGGDSPHFHFLPADDTQLAEEGQRHQGVGAPDGQVARDLLQLTQTGLQLRSDVVWGHTDVSRHP